MSKPSMFNRENIFFPECIETYCLIFVPCFGMGNFAPQSNVYAPRLVVPEKKILLEKKEFNFIIYTPRTRMNYLELGIICVGYYVKSRRNVLSLILA